MQSKSELNRTKPVVLRSIRNFKQPNVLNTRNVRAYYLAHWSICSLSQQVKVMFTIPNCLLGSEDEEEEDDDDSGSDYEASPKKKPAPKKAAPAKRASPVKRKPPPKKRGGRYAH